MNFSGFSQRLYPYLSGISSQGLFIGTLFNDAGSTFFPLHPSYGTDDNQRKLFRGARVFNKKMKDSFPKPIDTEKLKTSLHTRIGDSSLSQIMSNFGVPTEVAKNKDLFIAALCVQFQQIVSDATDDVDDIVLSEYTRLLREYEVDAESKKSPTDLFPLYPGDDILLDEDLPSRCHTVEFYEKFEHTWVVKNNGKVTWNRRRLEYTNQALTRVKALNSSIELPQVKPGNTVRLTAQFDARGFEGTYELIWEMKDDIGRLCFPDKSVPLKLTVSVENRFRITTGVANR